VRLPPRGAAARGARDGVRRPPRARAARRRGAKKKIAAVDPGAVALSVRNLENIDFPANRSFLDEHRLVVETVRAATGAPLIVGGGGFSVAPAPFLARAGGDCGVVGEGEEALCRLLERIAAGERPWEAPGGERIFRAAAIRDLDALARPDRAAAGEDFYVRAGGCATVQTKRGCDLMCSYCTYPLIEGSAIRTRSAAAVVDEMVEAGARAGIDHFTVVDSIFNNPEEHALTFCEELAGRGAGLKWTAYFRPEFRDPSFFRLLAASGCSGVDATCDSLSETTLASLAKGLAPGDVEAFCDGARAAGLPVNLNFIFGAPGEDERTFRETLSGIERCRPTSVLACVGVRLYPGAPLTAQLAARGDVREDDVGADPVFYLSERLPADFLETLGGVARADARWIVPGLAIRYNPAFFGRLRRHGRKGPIWRLV